MLLCGKRYSKTKYKNMVKIAANKHKEGTYMKLSEIVKLLNASVIHASDAHMEADVRSVCGSDMMSDVLAYVKDQGLLLTGLCNPQVVRTAEMMDISYICFVRGKKPDDAVKKLAQDKNIALISTDKTMYLACGTLYEAGLK